MKTAKRKGTLNEHRSRNLLEQQGYRVTRAGGSIGAWDLIAFSATDVLVIQCKTNEWPRSIELALLTAFPVPPCARKLVHRWRDGESKPDVLELGATS